MTDPIESESSSIGERLRAAREARGSSVQEAAEGLHLPVAVIESLEAERFGQLGAPIYVRGHLRSYLRWLGLPEVIAENAVQRAGIAPPTLHSATRTPTIKYLTDRYAMRAVYVLLTLSIIVPALWVATQHGGMGGTPRASRSLDVAPPVASGSVEDRAESLRAESPAPRTQGDRETVVASLAPFYTPPAVSEPEPAEVAAADALGEDAAGWVLRFTEDSWVEVLGQDGNRLEYGLIRANTVRRYPGGDVSRVALGNAGGVEVERAGQKLDLEPFRRANVARFAVSSDGSLRPSSD